MSDQPTRSRQTPPLPRPFRPFSVLPPPPSHPPPKLASRLSAASPQGLPDHGSLESTVGRVSETETKMEINEGDDNDDGVDIDEIVLEDVMQDDPKKDESDGDQGADSKESGRSTTPMETRGRKKVGARRRRLGDQSDESGDDIHDDPEYANIGVKFTAELEGDDEECGEAIHVDLIHPKVRKHHDHRDKEDKVPVPKEGMVQLRGSSSECEEGRKHKPRPNSNYRNMAPLPPPTSDSPEPYLPLTTMKTTGEPSSSARDLSSLSETPDGAHLHAAPDMPLKPPVRIKPKNRAPIPPPPVAFKRKSHSALLDEVERKKPPPSTATPLEKGTDFHQQPPPAATATPSMATAQNVVKPSLRKLPSAPSAPGPPIKPPRSRQAGGKSKATSSSTKETSKQMSADSKNSTPQETEAESTKTTPPSKGGGANLAPEGKIVVKVKRSSSPHQNKRAPPPPPPGDSAPFLPSGDVENVENELSLESTLTQGTNLREDAASDTRGSPASKHKITPSRTAPPPPQGPSSSPRLLHRVLQDQGKKEKKATDIEMPLVPPLPPKPAAYLDGPEPSVMDNSRKSCIVDQSEGNASTFVSEEVSSTLNAMKSRAQVIQESSFTPHGGSSRNSEELPAGYEMLSKMDYFSVELHRSEGQGYGMQIAEGTCATNKGQQMKGVFVMGVKPGSPAEASGRIKAQDMILEIDGVTTIGSSLENAAKLLKSSGNTVKVKLGRAQVTTDTSERHTIPGNSLHQQLVELRAENARLQDKISELQKELSQTKDAETDLTQALGKVTIEKTRMEREIQKLRDQASNHSNDQLVELQSSNKSLRAKLEEANQRMESLEKELQMSRDSVSQLQLEKKALAAELEEALQKLEKERESASRSSEELDNLRSELEMEKKAREQAEEMLILAQSAREVATTTAGDLHVEKKVDIVEDDVEETDSPLPVIVEHKPTDDGQAVDGEISPETAAKPAEEDGEEIAENEKEQQTSAEGAMGEEKEGKQGDDGEDVMTKTEVAIVVVNDEAKDSVSDIDDEELDKLGSLKCLDNTSAIEKAQLLAKRGRKRPSRKHIQTMADRSHFPEEMPPLKVLEGSGSMAGPLSPTGTPPQKLPKPELKVAPKPKPPTEASTKTQPQVVAPKPKPRPQPRKKPSPEHSSADTTAAGGQTAEVNKRPIPIPRSPSQEASLEDGDGQQPSSAGERLSSPPERLSQSPVHPGKMAPIVATKSPKASPVHLRKNVSDESPTSSSPAPPKKPKPHPPKPSPRPHKVDDSKATEEKPAASSSSSDSKLDELRCKDPSELTVKEKMMLAQVAMAKQAEQKSKGLPPPVMRKKPPIKMQSVDHNLGGGQRQSGAGSERESVHEQDLEKSMERSKSMENVLEDGQSSTPDQRRKLPPGAFNISIPMGVPGEMRHRSATHAGITSPDLDPKRFSKEIDHAQNDHQDEGQGLSQESHGTPKRRSGVPNAPLPEGTSKQTAAASSNVSTPDGSRREAVGGSSNGGLDESEDDLDDEVDTEADPDSLMQQVSSSPSTRPDPEQVLYWSPDVVGLWLSKIGLGKHSSMFIEKEIKGYVLFELDGPKLKGLGISSSDEKSVFKKEIKGLRPYADKIKKEYEKAKKDEKKRAEQEKKLAKKRKR